MKPFEGFVIQRQNRAKIPLIWAHFAPNLDIAVCAPIWKKLTLPLVGVPEGFLATLSINIFVNIGLIEII